MILPICICVLCVVILNSCTSNQDQYNVLTDQEKGQGWTLLFDGTSLNGWHVFNKGTKPSAWSADSGKLICNPHAKNIKHADLVTDKVYENYDLKFEWKISKAGNSGVFINVQERPEFGATFATGAEYQLLDDQNVEKDYLSNLSHKAAAIFGVVPNTSGSQPKSGAWNQSEIIQNNGKVIFRLNGIQTVQADFKSDDWKKMVAASSMVKYPSYQAALNGHIALQDWTSGVAFRAIKIKEL
jgi:Domain of Unknown Function (DUF1080)